MADPEKLGSMIPIIDVISLKKDFRSLDSTLVTDYLKKVNQLI